MTPCFRNLCKTSIHISRIFYEQCFSVLYCSLCQTFANNGVFLFVSYIYLLSGVFVCVFCLMKYTIIISAAEAVRNCIVYLVSVSNIRNMLLYKHPQLIVERDICAME